MAKRLIRTLEELNLKREAVEIIEAEGVNGAFDYFREKGIVKDWIAWDNCISDLEEMGELRKDASFEIGDNPEERLLGAFEKRLKEFVIKEREYLEIIEKQRVELTYLKTQHKLQNKRKMAEIIRECER